MNYTLNMSKRANIDVANSINNVPLYYRKKKILFFNELKDFLEILNSMPYLGKVISNYDFETRQIIFKKHRIIYIINEEIHQIYVLRILNCRLNFEDTNIFFENLIS